ncbi:MAG TPA: HipA domain-containing protein [Gemmatimonadota bacterium]|nr:HipA domain-containing protein [Gemmatimonadota bacterium]
MLFAPANRRDAKALYNAVRRGRVRRVARGIYTDDLDMPLERFVDRNLLAVLGTLFPDQYVSHSTAALLRPRNGEAFLSGGGIRHPLKLPGVTVNRLPELPHPEMRILELEELVATSLSADPFPARVRLSSPLQTIFEVLSSDARQPNRSLPEANIRGLIEAVSISDRVRAGRFALRNGLESEWVRFQAMAADLDAARSAPVARPSALELFFYHWRVGRLEELSGREYRFSYEDGWRVPLTEHLPVGRAYEGPGLPPFFENLLPEGWAEARLRAVHRLARDDVFGLLKTTQKYLSNLTLRPEGFDESRLALDELGVRLQDVAPEPAEQVTVVEAIGEAPDTRELWLELRRRGATRLSGVQAKLPIHLDTKGPFLRLDLAGLENPSTHILKFRSQDYPEIVQNEWATMELARRIGLPTPTVRLVAFQEESPFETPGLLIERFDLPSAGEEPELLFLLEDAASVLGLTRDEKYQTSLERVLDGLKSAGLPEDSFDTFLDHVVFSWLVGNGDLHAKNISILRRFRPGSLGAPPEPVGIEYSPLYDLLNTAIVIRGDLFALPVNGRANNLRSRDFASLARRLDRQDAASTNRIDRIVEGLLENLDQVLEASGLSVESHESYRSIVRSRIESL